MDLPKKDGFKEPYLYPTPKLKIYGIATLVAILSIVLLFEYLLPLENEGLVIFILGFIIIGSLTNILNTELHERTHYRVGSLLGYDPEMTLPWHRQSGRVWFPGQFVDANHNVMSLLSPLIFLSFVYAVLIFANFHWMMTLAIAIMFIMNAAGSGADIYGAYFDYKLPAGSIVYFPEGDEESYIFEPLN